MTLPCTLRDNNTEEEELKKSDESICDLRPSDMTAEPDMDTDRYELPGELPGAAAPGRR